MTDAPAPAAEDRERAALDDLPPTPENGDAMAWAEAFVAYVRAKPEIATDEGTMVGWFANAIEWGKGDEYQRGRRDTSAALASPAPAPSDESWVRVGMELVEAERDAAVEALAQVRALCERYELLRGIPAHLIPAALAAEPPREDDAQNRSAR